MYLANGVILDIDGTLLDSNDAHAEAFVRAMRAAGFDAEFTAVRRLIGMGSDKLLPAAIGVDAESAPGREIIEHKRMLLLSEYLPRLRPTPGARDLVEHFRTQDVVRVVASSAGAEEVQQLLAAAHVADLIDDVTTSDDVDDSKPEPDMVRSALRKSGLPARLVVMLGDTPYDLEAARRTGVRLIAVRCGGWSDADLAGAAAIYDDPADLLRELRGAPLRAGVF